MDWLTKTAEQIFDRKSFDPKSLTDFAETNRRTVFPANIPQPVVMINIGLCTNCDNLGRCVWQHNNKINCQHYK